MKAKELIKILNELIAKNGNLDILVPVQKGFDPADVKGVEIIKKGKFSPRSGFELVLDRNF